MEIEIKARLTDHAGLIKKLSALGCVFTEPTVQDDTVFALRAGTVDEYLSNTVFLRIREQGDEVRLTAKAPRSTSREELVKHEYELVVNSAAEARALLQLMGYIPVVRTVKTRRKAHFNEYEICLDEVEGLGTFIELERIAEVTKADHIQREMMEFLISLGISPEQRVTKGYDILQLEAAEALQADADRA